MESSKIKTKYKKTHLYLTRCNQYPLLPGPDNVVILINSTLWGKQPFCDHASHVFMPSPSLSSPGGSVKQVDKSVFFFPSLPASRFLGARLNVCFLTSL